jgi:hypothetical protein
LHSGTRKGKGGAADQSIHGRMVLGTACKEETSRMKNVSIEGSGGKKLYLWVRKTIFTETFTYIYIYIYIYIIADPTFDCCFLRDFVGYLVVKLSKAGI